MNKKLKFSCVVDKNTKFHTQAFIWINSILEFVKISPNDIYVHTVGDWNNNFTEWLKEKKINRIVIKQFDSRNRYCNKIKQLTTFINIEPESYIFFMDCDTIITSLQGLNLEHPIYAKVVDRPNPPINTLQDIFHKAKVEILGTIETSFSYQENNLTIQNNCNGGIYIISSSYIKQIEKTWSKYAKWCLDNLDIFKNKSDKFIDQVSFALATSFLEIQVKNLDIEWNFPLHINSDLLPDICPKIIHYHHLLDEHMMIKYTNKKKINYVIQKVNKLIKISLNKSFNNEVFWNNRYEKLPKLGSGIGSRGNCLKEKIYILKQIFNFNENKSVLDVGCGDLEVVKNFNLKHYTGIDISKAAIDLCKQKKPEWNFLLGDILQLNLDLADIVICFDVLIHQPSKQKYLDIVKKLSELCKDKLIVAAYNTPPTFKSEITFYYESIFETMKNLKVFSEISVVGSYRDTDIVIAQKYL